MARATKVTDVEVEKRLAAIEHAQGSIAHLAPERNLADELIADRRANDYDTSPIVPSRAARLGAGTNDLALCREKSPGWGSVDF